MTSILGIMASQISGHLVTNSYESIATTVVGSGGASTITFSSIPSTYKHLQVRAIAQNNVGIDNLQMRFNSDSTSSYSWHALQGNGSTAGATGSATDTQMLMGRNTNTTSFGAVVCDILDYTDTNKYKTIRSLSGYDNNGSGELWFWSGSWRKTNAVSTITLFVSNTINQYSSFALYGIKG